MARNNEIDEAFLKEVDDEVRRDQLVSWWNRWGKLLLIVVVIGLIALAAVLWWREHRASEAGVMGEKLLQAVDSVETGGNARSDALLAELKTKGSDGYRAAAMLVQADLLSKKGDAKAAAAAFAAVAGDKGAPKAYRDLALVRQTAMEFDQMKPADVVARLKPLAVDGNPWFASAGEMTALAYLKDGKPDLAGPIFAAIARDTDAPQTSRARASQMAAMLGIDAVSDADGNVAGANE